MATSALACLTRGGPYSHLSAAVTRFLAKKKHVGGMICFVSCSENMPSVMATRATWRSGAGGVAGPRYSLHLCVPGGGGPGEYQHSTDFLRPSILIQSGNVLPVTLILQLNF